MSHELDVYDNIGEDDPNFRKEKNKIIRRIKPEINILKFAHETRTILFNMLNHYLF